MNSHLLSLLHLTDPSLPIGGFSHSYGLETYVQAGLVNDSHSATNYIVQMLSGSLKYNDASFLSLTYTAAMAGDIDAIKALDTLCHASKLPQETRSASIKLGTRLHKIFCRNITTELLHKYTLGIDSKSIQGHYSIAFGIYAHSFNVPLPDVLAGFYYNAASGLVNNCIKLIPIGQQDGQAILFSILPIIESLVKESITPDTKLLGLSFPGFDIRCMQHEKLYSRLYMS